MFEVKEYRYLDILVLGSLAPGSRDLGSRALRIYVHRCTLTQSYLFDAYSVGRFSTHQRAPEKCYID